MWQEFIQQITDSNLFIIDSVTGLDYRKTDRPNWGTYDGEGNVKSITGEFVDGIELAITLKLNYESCFKKQILNNEIKIY